MLFLLFTSFSFKKKSHTFCVSSFLYTVRDDERYLNVLITFSSSSFTLINNNIFVYDVVVVALCEYFFVFNRSLFNSRCEHNLFKSTLWFNVSITTEIQICNVLLFGVWLIKSAWIAVNISCSYALTRVNCSQVWEWMFLSEWGELQ